MVSAAIVAVIKQVPDELAVMVAVADVFERVQPEAVPPEAMAYVIAPLPDEPEVAIERACI